MIKSEFREIECFITSDGKCFADKDSAVGHEGRINWDKQMEKDECFFLGQLNVFNSIELKGFLKRNKCWILEMMQWKDTQDD